MLIVASHMLSAAFECTRGAGGENYNQDLKPMVCVEFSNPENARAGNSLICSSLILSFAHLLISLKSNERL